MGLFDNLFGNPEAKRAIRQLDKMHSIVDDREAYLQGASWLNDAMELNRRGVSKDSGKMFQYFHENIIQKFIFEYGYSKNLIISDKEVAIRMLGLANKLASFHESINFKPNPEYRGY